MPDPDDHLSDVPRIIATRDDVASSRRPRAEASAEPRRAARAARSDAASAGNASGASTPLLVMALIIGIAGCAAAFLLWQQAGRLEQSLLQANQRIADLEGKLSTTDDSVTQSSAQMQVKIKELAGEVDKLWASAWRKNDGRLTQLEGSMKKAAGTFDAHQRRLTALDSSTAKLNEQVNAAAGAAASVATLTQQQAALQQSNARLTSTVTTLSNTQRAQEARIKESEQWVQSNIEFRKQVTQRLTRLENPPSALPSE